MNTAQRTASRPTARQSEYLAFIRAFVERYGVAPSFSEIARHFMTSTPSVNGMIKTLEARGFLQRVPGQARTLRVVVPSTEPTRQRTRQGRDEDLRNAQLRTAVSMATGIIERLIPALAGAGHAFEHEALSAVALALEEACLAAHASTVDRRHARAAFGRAVARARAATGEPSSVAAERSFR